MSGGFCKAAKKQRPLWFSWKGGWGKPFFGLQRMVSPRILLRFIRVRRESTWLFIRILIKRK
jgi:hypothetical protein